MQFPKFVKSVATFSSAALLASCMTAGVHPIAQPQLASGSDFDRVVDAAVDELPLQGVALAVWTPEGVYARGFGVADMESGAETNADTAFYIASSTKSFTALAMNILAHRGLIDLDSSLASFAPDAGFDSSLKPQQVTLRSLLTHTSGLEHNSLAYRSAYSGEHDPVLMWRLLSATEENEEAPLGAFDYANVGYNVLTILTDNKLGKNWQDIVADEILSKAGMTRTTAYMSKAKSAGWSTAEPHLTIGPGAPRRSDLQKTDATMHSAGGMVMSANDAKRWLELMINDGRIDGRQIIPDEIVAETRAPLVNMVAQFNGYDRDAYGLGWYVGRYRNDVLVHQFGNFAGARAHMSYMPDRKLGVAVFINDSGAGYFYADILANYVYDSLLGHEGANADYEQAVTGLVEKLQKVNAEQQKRATRESTLTLPHKVYAGTYENRLYGTVSVVEANDQLVVTSGVMRAVAEPSTKPDTIRVELVPGQGEAMTFNTNDKRGVDSLIYQDAVFVRR